MRIAFVGAEGVPYPNAFAKITEEIGWRLVEKGHSVTVYCRQRFVKDKTDFRGMKRVVLPSINTKHLDTISFSSLATLDLLRGRHDIDLVHFHGIGPSVLSFLPRLRGVRSVVHVHALDWQRAKWGRLARAYLKATEYSSVYFPDATIVVSQVLKQYLEKKFGRTIYYVPQGVDSFVLREPNEILSLGIRPNEYILFMGRLVPEKGCHYLIKAYQELKPTMQLVIAGGAAHTDAYARELNNNQNPNIRFLGHVSGSLKEELLSHAYLYIQPSEIEGLSLALLEAMSYGNCVVVSDIPENLEAMGQVGVTFKSRNYQDLRGKIDFLLNNAAIVKTYCQKAQLHVQAVYNWDKVAEVLETLYLTLLDE